MTDLPGLDLARVHDYLQRQRPGLLAGPLRGELITGGRSNLTYHLSDGHHDWVLRRPPLGHVLATAHDMSREHRVLAALADTAVPVPRVELLCPDPDVLGAPFYLMEHVPGTALRTPADCRALSPHDTAVLSRRLVEVLAHLHSIDPAQVGLDDFGRPDGFLRRQVHRWGRQLAASRSRDLPGIDQLHDWLGSHLPTRTTSAIVHGDYRLDNVLVTTSPPDITAVLDWEMATLGDPLADLGLLYVYWSGLGGEDDPITHGVTALPGFASAEDLLADYARRTGTDLHDLPWYVAFGYFKLAVIVEGIHYRYTTGHTVGEGFERIGALTQPLVRQGLAARTTLDR
ncbi:phosphotransferase family protein [Goodfellowiella coeruleoviolacea]|uniref:Kinase, aminoglycoside phosphotransferase (APT) family n=1 Tax=Goodfellowiella coeruleoviolacea TaxID=334858 RepID=A0AAE3GHP0_9PSEU|nr:phosphotransferase family protein [Goodfellowiella coeruleoviolacea]MCP2167574.1 putative kinase, aminoglycoside phosphotransferase (APT) family [Goodfellowiella coeruleoviolacea]